MDNSPSRSNEETEFLKTIEVDKTNENQLGEINQNLVALQEFGQAALLHWNETQQLTAETERQEMQLENEIHARNIKFACLALAAVVVIVIAAMGFGQFDTVDKIIDTLFKFLAGVGVAGFFVRKSQKKSE